MSYAPFKRPGVSTVNNVLLGGCATIFVKYAESCQVRAKGISEEGNKKRNLERGYVEDSSCRVGFQQDELPLKR